MPPIQIQELVYKPFCSDSEIKRIFNVKTAEDYLLKLRAETIADHMRLFRVFRNRALKNPDNWSLTRSFSQNLFQKYLDLLNGDLKEICKKIPAGFIFSNDPNGACMHTPFGNIVVVSNSLEYFLFYMNMAHLDFGINIPGHIRLASQQIAIRTMLKTESLDFDMDPRGIIPQDLISKNKAVVRQQILFIVGHEYAHHIHGHLGQNSIVELPLFAKFKGESEDPKLERFYNLNQQQEFEADSSSLSLIKTKSEPAYWNNLVNSTLLWFAYLDLYQQVSEQLFPVSQWKIRTHPEPIERFNAIYKQFGNRASIKQSTVDDMMRQVSIWKQFFLEDIAINTDRYELYGSVYLDKPNSEWRGREMIDRVDYY